MKTRRLWGLLLTALLAFGLCPALAFADEAQPAADEAGAATAADDAAGDAGKDEGDNTQAVNNAIYEGDKDGEGEEKP